jgi:hypothetical protein
VWVAQARRVAASVTLGFFLAAFPAFAQDAGVPDGGAVEAVRPFSAAIYEVCPAADPPVPVDVQGSFYAPVEATDGGQSWLLSPARASRNACLMATCEEHRTELATGVPVVPWTLLLAAGLGFALGGGAVGYLWWRFGR